MFVRSLIVSGARVHPPAGAAVHFGQIRSVLRKLWELIFQLGLDLDRVVKLGFRRGSITTPLFHEPQAVIAPRELRSAIGRQREILRDLAQAFDRLVEVFLGCRKLTDGDQKLAEGVVTGSELLGVPRLLRKILGQLFGLLDRF